MLTKDYTTFGAHLSAFQVEQSKTVCDFIILRQCKKNRISNLTYFYKIHIENHSLIWEACVKGSQNGGTRVYHKTNVIES